MKIVIVTHSSPYEARARAIQAYCKERGDQTLCVFSDFDHHAHKTRQEEDREDTVYLPLAPYQSNLSVKRMKSIYDFSTSVMDYLEKIDFDLLYVMVPANSLAAMAAKLKKKKNFRLIFDIIDLWPEALPLEKIGWLPPLQFWKRLRDKSLPAADRLVTECHYYKKFLKLPEEKTCTLYWVDHGMITSESTLTEAGSGDRGMIKIVYIGAINNIIDIEGISSLLAEIGKICRVQMHVVGDGEHRKDFLKTLRDHGIAYHYHGKVYDPTQKQEILGNCDFGINMMKKSVKVGLTMKSVDYLAHGLPLINNIQGDTWDMVLESEAGVNVGKGKEALSVAAREIAARWEEVDYMKENARRLYSKSFTRESFEKALSEILK